jgi:hypothetical protein
MMIDTSKYTGLQRLEGLPLSVYASPGVVPRAREIAQRCVRALSFFTASLDVDPDLALLVLAPEDWEGRAYHPVYGMPNYDGAGNLVVAGQPSDFWRSFVELVTEAQPAGLPRLAAVYEVDGELDLSSFFDLLAVHEMGHRFHQAGSVRFPRLWSTEFFCNLCLHTYVAEDEPSALPALEAFPSVISAVPPERVHYSDLATFERIYDRMPPQNYGWYQCHLHVAAKHVYDAGGAAALRRLWDRFRFSDEDLATALEEVEPQLARVFTEWLGAPPLPTS